MLYWRIQYYLLIKFLTFYFFSFFSKQIPIYYLYPDQTSRYSNSGSFFLRPYKSDSSPCVKLVIWKKENETIIPGYCSKLKCYVQISFFNFFLSFFFFLPACFHMLNVRNFRFYTKLWRIFSLGRSLNRFIYKSVYIFPPTLSILYQVQQGDYNDLMTSPFQSI